MQISKIKDWCGKVSPNMKLYWGRCLALLLVVLILPLSGTYILRDYLSRFGAEYEPQITRAIIYSYIGYALWNFAALWRSCVCQCCSLKFQDEIHSLDRVEENNNFLLFGLSIMFGLVFSQSNLIRLPSNAIFLTILALLNAGLGFLFYPLLPFIRLNQNAIPLWWIVFVRGMKSLFGATSLALSMLVLLNLRPLHAFKYSDSVKPSVEFVEGTLCVNISPLCQ